MEQTVFLFLENYQISGKWNQAQKWSGAFQIFAMLHGLWSVRHHNCSEDLTKIVDAAGVHASSAPIRQICGSKSPADNTDFRRKTMNYSCLTINHNALSYIPVIRTVKVRHPPRRSALACATTSQ
jgi:hypothetical protein